MIICFEKTDLLALLCVFFVCFVTFLYGVCGQVWHLIVLIPDLFVPLYFAIFETTVDIAKNVCVCQS